MSTQLIESLQTHIKELQEKVDEQHGILKMLSQPPLTHASVIGFNPTIKTVLLNVRGQHLEVVKKDPKLELKIGDVVQLNGMNHIIGVFPQELLPNHSPEELIQVAWNQVGGLKEAKEKLQDIIELPHTHKELFAKYGKRHSKGVLLYGPPGNGKTLLGKAAATSLAKLHGHSCSTGFIYVKGPEVRNMYVGESEANVRRLFERAKKHKEKHGYPALIFIDEADALLSRRDGQSSRHDNSVVASFLAETDGMQESAAILMLTTNRPESLDPAILRDGRVDSKIRIDGPCFKDAVEIVEVHLKDKPLVKSLCATATECCEAVFEQRHDGFKNRISGALLAELVQQAGLAAIKRNIAGDKVVGIGSDDVKLAIEIKIEEMAGINQGGEDGSDD